MEPSELVPFMIDLSFNAYHDDKTVVAIWNIDLASTTDLSDEDAPEAAPTDV
jgi:hypothetical protein